MKRFTCVWNAYVKEVDAVDQAAARKIALVLFAKYKRFKPSHCLLVLEQ